MEKSLKEIAQEIAGKMKDKSSFSNETFNILICNYDGLTDDQKKEVKRLAKQIFERDYNFDFGR